MNKLMNAMSKSDPPLAYIFLKGSIQEQEMKIRLDKSTTGPFFLFIPPGKILNEH